MGTNGVSYVSEGVFSLQNGVSFHFKCQPIIGENCVFARSSVSW